MLVRVARRRAVTIKQRSNFDLGMVLGGIYEVIVFQAERNQCESNFRVTLRNFSRPVSACASRCGDGIVSSAELCDDGTNDSVYNGCAAGCVLAPFCGDGIVQAAQGEECDDGVNTSLYGGCAPGCKKGPLCGDGLVPLAKSLGSLLAPLRGAAAQPRPSSFFSGFHPEPRVRCAPAYCRR
ncbi:MAG TPA: DUF4215 domain-containing protein, partial [Polyangiaceae bacterium]|nr:DUF4215 domain-containing protein [Polyangiaceae bacterium]